jgi:hypothetical protein
VRVPTPYDAPSVSIACPSCRRLVPAGAPCPHCAEPPVPHDLTLVLAAPPVDDTAELELVPPVPEVLPVSSVPSAAPAWAVSDAPAPRRTPAPKAVAVAVAALALVGGAAVLGLRATGHGDPAPTTGDAAPVAAVVPVAEADVHASASSTQQPDSGITYTASNTLDGRPETAWNSDGRGAGVTLVYTFARPVDLRSITVLNGYQKVRAGSSGPVDLYPLNARVRTFTVVTDDGSTGWTLRDDRAPQTLTHTFGRTRTVRLRVEAVYPSRKYQDLAVSEVRFGAAGS